MLPFIHTTWWTLAVTSSPGYWYLVCLLQLPQSSLSQFPVTRALPVEQLEKSAPGFPLLYMTSFPVKVHFA